MTRSFGHEDAALATLESLDNIVTNFEIEEFLRSNNKRYLVGPKGAGKTLLLLRKAIDQRNRGDGICIPSSDSNPVDRLTATFNVGIQFNYRVADPKENHLAWAAVWKNSIYRSVLHHLRDRVFSERAEQLEDEASWETRAYLPSLKRAQNFLKEIISETALRPRGPFHYFTILGSKLDESRHDAINEVSEQNLQMQDLIEDIGMPVYVFLDNLDDYYEREPALWFNSMYGQFRAVREIGLAHRNIHVFTSIRRDVYKLFKDEMHLQYYDYVAKLEYSKNELLEIFASRVTELDDDLLIHPELKKKDPWKAFFGDCEFVRNGILGVNEKVSDYMVRHTLGRPRDVIHMGTVLLSRLTKNRDDPNRVHRAIQAAEEDIAEQYLREVGPLFGSDFSLREFVSELPSNVLTSDETKAVRDALLQANSDLIHGDRPTVFHRPFATLFELGLLGIVRKSGDSDVKVQQFRQPGHGLPEIDERSLPESEVYLIHPVLNFLIPESRRSKSVLIGQDLPYKVMSDE